MFRLVQNLRSLKLNEKYFTPTTPCVMNYSTAWISYAVERLRTDGCSCLAYVWCSMVIKHTEKYNVDP